MYVTDDEISEGSAKPGSPFQRLAMKLKRYSVIVQPNHIETVIAEVEVDGAPHLVKFSRYHDNQQFWTVPGERDERLHGRNTITVTEPEPDEYELYDLTLDPFEERNLAHPSHASDDSRRLQETMFELLIKQLDREAPRASRGRVARLSLAARGRQSRCRRLTRCRRQRERTGEAEGADRLLHAHEPGRAGRGRDGEGARGARLRGDEGADRVHRRTVGADALASFR